jgi:hypothetical protein
VQHASSEPPRRALQDSRDQRSSVIGGDDVTQGAWTVEFAIRDRRSLTPVGPESIAKILKIIQSIKHHPRAESRLFADQFS